MTKSPDSGSSPLARQAAGDVDYEVHGAGYARQRRPDPRIAALIHAQLGSARTVLNVGAGAGSYEPDDRHVIAIEPSAAMRAQRPRHLAPAINAVAEQLPLDDQSVDASMATLTVHQWRDREKGLAELRRVTRGPIVVMAFETSESASFWLHDYVPELAEVERRRDPPIDELARALSTPHHPARVLPVPIPIDCTDGFTAAFYARPERFLDPAVLQSQSTWSFLSPDVPVRFITQLRADLQSGRWDARFGSWRTRPQFVGSLRLVVGGRPLN